MPRPDSANATVPPPAPVRGRDRAQWAGVDNSALSVVPQDERRSWWSITLVMTAIGIDLSGMFLGLALAKGLTLLPALGAVLLGSTLLGLLGIMCALVGARTGMSSALIASFTFGREGARLVAGVMGLSLLGWFAVQAGFLGQNLASALLLIDVQVPAGLLSAIGGVLMTWTGVQGYRAMDRLSRWSVPVMLSLIGMALAMQAFRMGSAVEQPVTARMDFVNATSFVVGAFIATISTFPDLARFARSTKDAVLGAFFGFLIGNSITLVVAVLLARFTGEADLVRLFASLHLGLFAVVVLVLAQWTTNASNLYSASLSFSVVGRGAGVPQAVYACAVGAIGTVLAVAGIADEFLGFLGLLSMLIAPIGGAYCGRYFVVLRGQLPASAPGLVVSTALAWALGCLVAWLTTPNDPGGGLHGWGAFTLTHIPPLDGFVVAFMVAAVPAWARRRTT